MAMEENRFRASPSISRLRSKSNPVETYRALYKLNYNRKIICFNFDIIF